MAPFYVHAISRDVPSRDVTSFDMYTYEIRDCSERSNLTPHVVTTLTHATTDELIKIRNENKGKRS